MADGLSQLRAQKQKAARKRTVPPPPMHPKPETASTEPDAEIPSQVSDSATEEHNQAPAPSESSSPTPGADVAGQDAWASWPEQHGEPAPQQEEERAQRNPPDQSSNPAPGTDVVERRDTASPAVVAQWDSYAFPPAGDVVPKAEEVLEQRFFTREPLNASVPRQLEIGHRLQVLKVISRIERIPPADLVAVGLDWFLRGGSPDVADVPSPWNRYRGPGTPEHIPRAESLLQQRWLEREPLKASVPQELQLNHRLALFRVMNRLTKVPAADVVAVGMDRWLRLMGF